MFSFLVISFELEVNPLKFTDYYSFKRQPHKMVKHTQTIRWQEPANCLSVFDYFVGLALKDL